MFRESIRYHLRKSGLTQRALCDDLGITLQNFSSYLNGARTMPLSRLLTVMTYLGLEFSVGDEADGGRRSGIDPAAIVAFAMRRKGLKQKEAAELAGVNKSAISSFVNGHGRYPTGNLERLAEVLGIEIREKEKENEER